MKTNLMKYALLALVLAAMALPASAQYRQNDALYAANGSQPFGDPNRVSPNQEVVHAVGDGEIVIEWGAPSVRGRRLAGGLISTYKVWRTGANEASTIHFSKDVLVEGEKLPAGTYALFTIGGKKKWTIIFNEESQQWGAFTYDRKKDVLRVKVEPGENEHQEAFNIDVVDAEERSANIRLRWGTLDVRFRVEVDPEGA